MSGGGYNKNIVHECVKLSDLKKCIKYQSLLYSVFKNNTYQREGPDKIIFNILSNTKCEYIYTAR